MAYAREEGLPHDRAEWQRAVLASMFYNANRDAKKGEPAPVSDFIPGAKPEAKAQPVTKQLALMDTIARANNERAKRKQR